MPSRTFTIINKLGLHARAAAKLVSAAGGFRSSIQVEKDGQTVNAKSIMGVMMLAAAKGSEVTVHAEGDDADAALDAIETLINERFGEGE